MERTDSMDKTSPKSPPMSADDLRALTAALLDRCTQDFEDDFSAREALIDELLSCATRCTNEGLSEEATQLNKTAGLLRQEALAEAEAFKFTVLNSPPGEDVTVHDIFEDGCALYLENLLSQEECEHYITQMEHPDMGLAPCGYSTSVRVTDRTVVKSGELASVLFARVQPFLKTMDCRDTFERGLRKDSANLQPVQYEPYGLNTCMRLCRYHEGGFFTPHYDYGHEDERGISLKTFMVYLNDTFTGGPTGFYNEEQEHYVQPSHANRIYALQPSAGSCLLFNHHITHDGGRVESGKKYLLRSEVMYKAGS